ncbi:DUF4411 family protein [Bradyrhizobium liaoningense]|uniref:DUF4411 family protein n=1 Tax=Bradyrhizobium liaoningense TaxID=43992 RepID=UPI0024BFE9B7|nr:DUF4411 family protein [Bradyrhizobium liaoningense]
MPENASGGSSSSSSLLIRSKNPRRCQAENPLKLLSEFAGPALYPLDRIPEFWDWLLHQGAQGQLKIPLEMVEEIREGTDEVAAWISERDHLHALTWKKM